MVGPDVLMFAFAHTTSGKVVSGELKVRVVE